LITINNWSKLQHYKDRKPPWIKLYRDLLDDLEYRELSDFSARFLIDLWLLASEQKDGVIKMDSKKLLWRLRYEKKKAVDLDKALKELEKQGFIHIASTTIASCKQDAIPETETETETKIGFDVFWKAYPRKQGKDSARRKWNSLSLEDQMRIMEDIARRFINADPTFIPYGSTYLNKKTWEDDISPNKSWSNNHEAPKKLSLTEQANRAAEEALAKLEAEDRSQEAGRTFENYALE
jgi:hypothetical protein